MDIAETGTKLLSRLHPRVARVAERSLQRIPPVRRALDREYGRMLAALEPHLKPYRGQVTTHVRLPAKPETGLSGSLLMWDIAGTS